MEQLTEAIRTRTALLFVGAGVSQSLALPSWSALVGEIGRQLGYDPDVFRTLGDYLELAEYFKLQKGSIAPLRSWMDREWHAPTIKIESSRVHELIVKLGCPLVYTTNYDQWLERAYAHYGVPFVKVSGAADLPGALPGTTQIVKFHGDFEGADEDLVLSETDYFKRLSLESVLDVKLRADLVGRVALFIGYSLTDINVRYMLFKLQQLWSQVPRFARPKSYMFLSKPNPVKEAVLKLRGVTAIPSEVDDPNEGLVAFLDRLYRDAAA